MPAVRAVASSSNQPASSYTSHGDSSHGDNRKTPTGSFIVYVNDARRGQISVMNGEDETVTNDPDLVRRIVRAANS
jgi:hypothetical protein